MSSALALTHTHLHTGVLLFGAVVLLSLLIDYMLQCARASSNAVCILGGAINPHGVPTLPATAFASYWGSSSSYTFNYIMGIPLSLSTHNYTTVEM